MRPERAIALALTLNAVPVSADVLDDAEAAYKRKDYQTALRLWRKLAEQGDAWAQTFLGLMYSDGSGVPQDYAEAVKWYRRAAEQGNAASQHNLGFMYAKGEGIPQDFLMAHMWFNLASAQGNEAAITNRAIVEQNMTREQIAEAQRLAREWLAKHQ
jgi:TPR repeat protein